MSEAEQLPREILENGDVVGWDGAGRNVIQLALDDAEMDRLMAFGADEAECEDAGDDEPYEVPPVHACWFKLRRALVVYPAFPADFLISAKCWCRR
jgi:hypothetical protein